MAASLINQCVGLFFCAFWAYCSEYLVFATILVKEDIRTCRVDGLVETYVHGNVAGII